jgi:hypothetical protein
MGVIFFVYNAVFSLVLIIIVLVASIISVCAKNPDTRYQPMRDDRGSFIKSQSQLNTELDALGATTTPYQEAAATACLNSRPRTTPLTSSGTHTWSLPDHHYTPPPLGTTPTADTRLP